MKNLIVVSTLLLALSAQARAETLLNAKFLDKQTRQEYSLQIAQTGPDTALAVLTRPSGEQSRYPVRYSKWSQDPLDGGATIERSHFSGLSEQGEEIFVNGNNRTINNRAGCYHGYAASVTLGRNTRLEEALTDNVPRCPQDDFPFPGN